MLAIAVGAGAALLVSQMFRAEQYQYNQQLPEPSPTGYPYAPQHAPMPTPDGFSNG